MQKQGVFVLWFGSLAAWFLGGGWISTAGQVVFGLTFVAHIVEFVINRPLFEKADGSMGHHFVQTMIYGFLHWQPIKERLAAESGGATPAE